MPRGGVVHIASVLHLNSWKLTPEILKSRDSMSCACRANMGCAASSQNMAATMAKRTRTAHGTSLILQGSSVFPIKSLIFIYTIQLTLISICLSSFVLWLFALFLSAFAPSIPYHWVTGSPPGRAHRLRGPDPGGVQQLQQLRCQLRVRQSRARCSVDG